MVRIILGNSLKVGRYAVAKRRRASLDILRIDIEDSFIYYNSGNVGIGTATIQSSYKLQVQGNAWVENQLVFNNSYRGGGGDFPCNKILLYGGGNVPTNTSAGEVFGFGVAANGKLEYFASNTHAFYTGTTGGTNYGTERMVITSGGNVGIGTNNPQRSLHVQTSMRIGGTGACLDFGDDFTTQIYRNGTTQEIIFSTSSTERLRITSGGNVGIGTNAPGFLLDVASSTTDTGSGPKTFFNYGYTNLGTAPLASSSCCARFRSSIWTYDFVLSSSDSRIKEDIQDINDDSALQSILSIEPKTYKYIDEVSKWGNNKVYGFIAQQIRDIFPNAVSIQEDYIPNIYLVADYIDYVITLSSQPTKVVIKMNDKIKCYDKDNKEILVEVIEVIDDLTFRIKEIEYTDTKIFVYGTFVDDFHTLNKDYIFTLNVCATQELHRRIEAQSVLLKSQEDRIKDLETKVATLMSNM